MMWQSVHFNLPLQEIKEKSKHSKFIIINIENRTLRYKRPNTDELEVDFLNEDQNVTSHVTQDTDDEDILTPWS